MKEHSTAWLAPAIAEVTFVGFCRRTRPAVECLPIVYNVSPSIGRRGTSEGATQTFQHKVIPRPVFNYTKNGLKIFFAVKSFF
jgi:hypothetical protein